MKILRYNIISLTVGEVLVIVAAALIISTVWPAAPWWIFVILGVAIGMAAVTINKLHARSKPVAGSQ